MPVQKDAAKPLAQHGGAANANLDGVWPAVFRI